MGLIAPFGFWTLLSILLGLAAFLSIGFDLKRLQSRLLIVERIQFDDRRIERVWREEPSGKERWNVVAYDALQSADIRRGTLGLYEIGNELPKQVFGLDEFSSEQMVLELLARLKAREVSVLVEDDSLALQAAEWTRATR